jgi:hypothetical protein
MSEIEQLLERIDVLQALLACYRLGVNPRESLFSKLDRTKANEDTIRASLAEK